MARLLADDPVSGTTATCFQRGLSLVMLSWFRKGLSAARSSGEIYSRLHRFPLRSLSPRLWRALYEVLQPRLSMSPHSRHSDPARSTCASHARSTSLPFVGKSVWSSERR